MRNERAFDTVVFLCALVAFLMLWWWLADRPRFWEWL